MQPNHITKVLLDVGTEKTAVRMESSFLKWKMCSKIDDGDGYTYLDIQHQVWTVHSKWVNCGACEICLNDVFLFRWQYNPVWARKERKLWPHAKAKLTGSCCCQGVSSQHQKPWDSGNVNYNHGGEQCGSSLKTKRRSTMESSYPNMKPVCERSLHVHVYYGIIHNSSNIESA